MTERSSAGEWIITLGDDETAVKRFAAVEELSKYLDELSLKPEGRISAIVEYGIRPWWQRFLGMSQRDFALKFAMEWCEEFASLIFHDEAGSEYRVLDHAVSGNPEECVRHRLSPGELSPAPAEECMTTTRAWAALNEYVRSGARPAWLEYRHVR